MKNFILVSLLDTLIIYILSTFIMLDPMWFFQKIIDLLKGSPTDRLIFLVFIPVKIFIDACVYLPIFKTNEK